MVLLLVLLQLGALLAGPACRGTQACRAAKARGQGPPPALQHRSARQFDDAITNAIQSEQGRGVPL